MSYKILVAGGGTGGHIYPALATIEALQKKGEVEILYVGGRGGIENKIVPPAGIPMRNIRISGFQRYFTLKNVLFPIKLLIGLMQSWKIVKKFDPCLAVGTGGYVSGPVLYAAKKAGKPVVIQEQDVYPGVTTRLLAKFADKVFLSYERTAALLELPESRYLVTGNPVRQQLRKGSAEEAKARWHLDSSRPVLFVFGGSQGARSINRAMLKLLPELLDNYELQVIWQTGEKDFKAVKNSLNSDLQTIHLTPYLEDISEAYSVADFVISRAGAITLAELAIVAVPAILVPYPHAAGNHQEKNAVEIERAGAAVVVTEGEGWESNLKTEIENLLTNRELRRKMSTAWQKLARPDAAERIAEEIFKIIGF